MARSLSPPAVDAACLARLLALRLDGRVALQRALLQALFGADEVDALDARACRRLAALLEGRDDAALEAMAWQGHAGREALRLQVELVLEGRPAAAELQASLARLADWLRRAEWTEPTFAVRGVLVSADLPPP